MNALVVQPPTEAELEQIRQQLVTICIEEGELQVCRTKGIPLAALREMQQTDWWKQASQQYYLAQSARLDKGLSEIIDKALSVAKDRLENGDAHYDRYEGVVNLPMKGKDAAAIVSSLVDKRQALRGLPGSIIKHEINLTAVAEKLRSIVPEPKAPAEGRPTLHSPSEASALRSAPVPPAKTQVPR